jgi:(2Fe-2S) ferredoxin
MKGLILLSRGEHNRAPHDQLSQLIERVSDQLGGDEPCKVVGAFVDRGAPSLPDALQLCAESGARSITVLPVFLPGDASLEQWLAKVILRWQETWSGEHLELRLLSSPAGGSGWSEAVMATLREAFENPANVVPLPAVGWQTDPASWSNVPPHRYHLLVCRGPRCTARGADALWQHLAERLAREDRVENTQGTLTVSTGCLYPCGRGPILAVYPDNVWYGVPSLEALDEIIDEHLLNGRCVAKYRIPS